MENQDKQKQQKPDEVKASRARFIGASVVIAAVCIAVYVDSGVEGIQRGSKQLLSFAPPERVVVRPRSAGDSELPAVILRNDSLVVQPRATNNSNAKKLVSSDLIRDTKVSTLEVVLYAVSRGLMVIYVLYLLLDFPIRLIRKLIRQGIR